MQDIVAYTNALGFLKYEHVISAPDSWRITKSQQMGPVNSELILDALNHSQIVPEMGRKVFPLFFGVSL